MALRLLKILVIMSSRVVVVVLEGANPLLIKGLDRLQATKKDFTIIVMTLMRV